MRVGLGYDLHRLEEGRELVLGGVTVPHTHGLAGHSDADVLTHAICDAILGAAALGDLGTFFPDTDEQWRGANSLALLQACVEHVANAGYVVANVDATLIAERPKLATYRDEMRASLAAALSTDMNNVSVKFTTNEGVDAVGRGEAMAAHAVVLLTET